jgi:REP element-mobilizing transposase RayT
VSPSIAFGAIITRLERPHHLRDQRASTVANAKYSKRVWTYQSRILQNLECNSITIGGVADHVHVLCNLTKKFPTAKVIEILKKDSSKFIKSGEEIHPRSGRAPQEGDIPGRVFADFEKMRRSCGS